MSVDDLWVKQLCYVRDLRGLKAVLDATGWTIDEVVSVTATDLVKFIRTTRFSMLNLWDVIELSPSNPNTDLAGMDLVVRIERADPSLTKRDDNERLDWAWDNVTMLRRPLAYSSIIYSIDTWASMRMKQSQERAHVVHALETFDLFLPTAIAPCWMMFNAEKMEFGFTFMDELDAVAYEALRLT